MPPVFFTCRVLTHFPPLRLVCSLQEGFEPPYDHYVKEQKNLWNQPGLAERQKMVKDRVKHMQGEVATSAC